MEVIIMNSITFRPVFRTSKPVSQDIMNVMIDEFVDRRNIACRLLNPHYEEWNNEYNESHPNNKGGVDGDPEYVEFINQKQNEILKQANEKILKTNIVSISTDEQCDLVGVYRADESIILTAELIPC
jgi:hypothetical protein